MFTTQYQLDKKVVEVIYASNNGFVDKLLRNAFPNIVKIDNQNKDYVIKPHERSNVELRIIVIATSHVRVNFQEIKNINKYLCTKLYPSIVLNFSMNTDMSILESIFPKYVSIKERNECYFSKYPIYKNGTAVHVFDQSDNNSLRATRLTLKTFNAHNEFAIQRIKAVIDGSWIKREVEIHNKMNRQIEVVLLTDKINTQIISTLNRVFNNVILFKHYNKNTKEHIPETTDSKLRIIVLHDQSPKNINDVIKMYYTKTYPYVILFLLHLNNNTFINNYVHPDALNHNEESIPNIDTYYSSKDTYKKGVSTFMYHFTDFSSNVSLQYLSNISLQFLINAVDEKSNFSTKKYINKDNKIYIETDTGEIKIYNDFCENWLISSTYTKEEFKIDKYQTYDHIHYKSD